MNFYLYTAPLRSKKRGDFIGTLVKLSREKEEHLDLEGIRRYSFKDKDNSFARWSFALQRGELCDDGFTIIPQTEKEFVNKITGKKTQVRRTSDWQDKLEIKR